MTDSASLKRCSYPDHEGPRELPASEFYKDRGKRDGLTSWCKTCINRRARAIRAADPEKARTRQRRRRAANLESARESSRRWARANPESRRRWAQANPEKTGKIERRYRDKFRDQVLDHYGRECACAGCGATGNLQIDHVNGNGRAHRLELFGRNSESHLMYRWLIKQGFPPGFQVLCQPCNSSKRDGVACHLDHSGTGLKYCSCPEHENERWLPPSEFHKNRSMRDGLASWCRACRSRTRRMQRARAKEQFLARGALDAAEAAITALEATVAKLREGAR
jgi:hypothetical protein